MIYSEILGPLSAFGSSVTWALGVTTYSAISSKYPVAIINYTRVVVALPLFLLTVGLAQGNLTSFLAEFSKISMTGYLWLALSMVCSHGFGDLVFLASARSLGIPGALAISSSYPLLSGLGGWIFKGEVLSTHQWMGLILIVAGVGTVILTGYSALTIADQKKSYLKGAFLAFLTSVLWAVNTYAISEGGKDLSTPVANSVRMGFALIFGLLFISATLGFKSYIVPWKDLKRPLPIFAFEVYGGSFCFMYGLTHASLAVASSLSSLSPVISLPLTWMWSRKLPSLGGIVGVLMVVTGIWMLVL